MTKHNMYVKSLYIPTFLACFHKIAPFFASMYSHYILWLFNGKSIFIPPKSTFKNIIQNRIHGFTVLDILMKQFVGF